MFPSILFVLPWVLSHPASEPLLNRHVATGLATDSRLVNNNKRSIHSELAQNRNSPLYQLINAKQFPANINDFGRSDINDFGHPDINNFGRPGINDFDLNLRPSVSHLDGDTSQKGRSVFLVFHRPGVARAVLHTALSFLQNLSKASLPTLHG